MSSVDHSFTHSTTPANVDQQTKASSGDTLQSVGAGVSDLLKMSSEEVEQALQVELAQHVNWKWI